MGDGHLGKAAHQQEGDQRADGVTQEDGRTGEANGEAAAEEESGADGAADGDHGELAGGQAAMQPFLAVQDFVELRARAGHRL